MEGIQGKPGQDMLDIKEEIRQYKRPNGLF